MSTTSVLGSVLAATTGASSDAINVTSTVATILYADRAPERAWQAQQTILATQTGAINTLESEASSLTDALNALQDGTGALSAINTTSSNTGLVTASALAGTASGTHTVVVNSLATSASWYSESEKSSSTTLTAGSFSISAGGKTTQITTGDGVNTLDQLAASINSQALGVTAGIVSDSSGSRLSLVAQTSGAAADFSITQATGQSFTLVTSGVDASLTVDGVPIKSASNTVTGALSGVSLSLLGASPGTKVILTLAPDATAISTAVSAFVTAYNALIKDVNSQFAYNSVTKTAGTLSTDSAVQGLQGQLLNSTNYSSGSGALQTLASLGVVTHQDGTLTLNSTTLATAVANNSSAITNFFQGSFSDGFVASLQNSLATYTDPSYGAFTVDLSSFNNENTDLTSQTSTLELYLATQQTALTTQYNLADIALTQLPLEIKQLNALLNPSSSGN